MKYEFRGYCETKGKWVYGYLAADNVIIDATAAYIVDKSSVSIWTGEYDTRAKKIFVNDIIRCGDNIFCKVDFYGGSLIAITQNDEMYLLSDVITVSEIVANDYII